MNSEQSKLFETVKSSLNQRNVDCILALDGSSSISTRDFSLLKKACIKLLDVGRPETWYGALQFSHVAELIWPLEGDQSRVGDALLATKQLGMTTSTDVAFIAAQDYFRNSPRYAYSRRVMILITDGHPIDQVMAHAHALVLLSADNARVIVIAVGREVRKDRIHVLASPGCSFFLENFQQLFDTFKRADGLPEVLREYEISIDYEVVKWPIRFKDELNLMLTVTNKGRTCIPGGSEIVFFGTSQFEESYIQMPFALPDGQYMTLPLRLYPCYRVDATTLTDYIPFQLRIPDDKVAYAEKSVLEMYMHTFCGDAIYKRSKKEVEAPDGFGEANILLVGKSDSGKTSYLNTVVNCFSPAKELYRAQVASHHEINELTRWRLNLLAGAWFDAEITLWSFRSSDCDEKEFGMLLNGNICGKYHIKDAIDFHDFIDLETESLPRSELRMTAVCFFLTPDMVETDIEELEQIARLVNVAYEQGRKPIVILTHMDLEKNILKQEVIRSRLSHYFGIPETHIMMVENYYIEFEKKNFEKEKLAYGALLKAIQLSDKFNRASQSI